MASVTNGPYQEAHCLLPGIRKKPYFDGDLTFNTGIIRTFSPFEYTFFVLSLFIPTMIGFYQAWRYYDSDEFLLARRSMRWFPVALSLLASFVSAITMSGSPAKVYFNSIQHLWMAVGTPFICLIVAQVYMPMFYELNLASCYEYLQLRFNKGTRTVGALMFTVHSIVYMSVVMYTPSAAISGVTGLNMWGSIVAVTVGCTLYVTVGGIRAAIWADSFQMVLMYLTLIIALIAANKVVGASNMVESGQRTGRLEFFDPSETFTQLIGNTFGLLSIYAVNQSQVHRYLTCTSLRSAMKAIWINFPGHILMAALCISLGLYMSALYENCDPLQARFVGNPTQITPFFMQDILGDTPGLMGFFLAGISSGTLSTVSSCLNSLTTVVIEDVLRVYFQDRIKEEKRRLISQIISILFGFICLEMTFLVSRMGSDVIKITSEIHGSLHGPLLGLFSLGMFLPWANSKGALTGVLSALVFNIAFLMLSGRPVIKRPVTCVSNCDRRALTNATLESLTRAFSMAQLAHSKTESSGVLFSPAWLPPMSSVLCVLVGIIVSFFTGFQKPKNVDPRLIVPVFDVLFPLYYLPESTRRYLRFGINHENKYKPARPHRPPGTRSLDLVQESLNKEEVGKVCEDDDLSSLEHSFQSQAVETAV